MTQLELAYLIGGAAGLLVGVVLATVICRSRSRSEAASMARLVEVEKGAAEEKLAFVDARLTAVSADLSEARRQLDHRRDAMAQLEAANAALSRTADRVPVLEAALQERAGELEARRSAALELEKKLSALATQLEAERRQNAEKLAVLDDARERLTHEFKVLADRILESQSQTFTERNQRQMDGLIGPLRQQLVDFKKRVEDVYDKESRDRAALRSEIGRLKDLNERIGKDALNLTNALKGDVKTLGGWGEVILERILEASGLEKGRLYERQVSLGDARGSRYQPDVVIRLPEGRDVIVDAKVSLKAYERYHTAQEEAVRAAAIRDHLSSLRAHLNGLNAKHYEDLPGIRSLDFVLMFVPIEAAFFTALEHDRALFGEAFEKNVILVSPSTLLVTLRTIHNMWRNADQNRNALEIARQAGGLYDKFIGFIEVLETLGQQLDRARDAHRTAVERLCSGRGNLVRRTEMLKALGVKANKALPAAYADALAPGDDALSEEL